MYVNRLVWLYVCKQSICKQIGRFGYMKNDRIGRFGYMYVNR